jgi:hypothetical protein
MGNALLALNSTTKYFLPPRMTKAQRNAIGSPAQGSTVYQTDGGNSGLRYYDGGWKKVSDDSDDS